VTTQFRVQPDLCDGCGQCVEVCAVEAISLVGGVARIDQVLCLGCRACEQVCPQGAIEVVSPVVVPSVVKGAEAVPAEILRGEVVMPARPRSSVLRTAGTALAAMGTWLVPRLADALVAAAERRFAEPAVSDRSSRAVDVAPSEGAGGGGRQRRRQRRSRGGR